MDKEFINLHYPRRRAIRWLLRSCIRLLLSGICDIEVIGMENYPKEGPLLMVINHFSFLDPVATIHFSPRQLEFLGGVQLPNSPVIVNWLPRVYGVLHVRRGSVSRDTLFGAQALLKKGAVLSIFPEAGNWASVLRPARPGTALLATRNEVPLLPVGLDGLTDVFPMLRKGKRAKVTIRVGKPFGPYYVSERDKNDRQRLDEIGHEIMRKIAELIPDEKRGYYADDPATREAAKGTEVFPWTGNPEIG